MLATLLCAAPQGALADASMAVQNALAGLPRTAELSRLYAGGNHGLLWTVDGAATPQLATLLSALVNASRVGLRPADYDSEGLVAAAARLPATGRDPDALAAFDIRASKAVLSYVKHLHFGRIEPRTAGLDLAVTRDRLDVPAEVLTLSRSANPAALLGALEPQFHHYELLKLALERYRKLAQRPELTQLPPLSARSYRSGDAYAGSEQLRRLLVATGDLEAAQARQSGPTIDAALSEGIRTFQTRHGLDADGALGRNTWKALTTSFDARVRQIELTLERWRWLPTQLDASSIFINIPQFELFAFPGREDLADGMLSMKVVVGDTISRRRTPVFVADMTHVILHPYWEVPREIAARELLPKIRADAAYMADNQLEVVGSTGTLPPSPENLARVEAGQLRLRQKPGPDNALGLVKFVMPNSFSVYLHDTPAKRLFALSRRSFSHGCIRLSDALALAQFVLRDNPAWTRERLLQGMNGPEPRRIDLAKPIRVFIVYGTALARERGDVMFFDDLYGHDARLARVLNLP